MDRFLDFQYSIAMEELNYYSDCEYDSAMEGKLGESVKKVWSAISGAVVKAALFIAKIFSDLASKIRKAFKNAKENLRDKAEAWYDKFDAKHPSVYEVHPDVAKALDASINKMHTILDGMKKLPTFKDLGDAWVSDNYDSYKKLRDDLDDSAEVIYDMCNEIMDMCQGKYNRGKELKRDPHVKYVSVGIDKMVNELDRIAYQWKTYSKTYENSYKLYESEHLKAEERTKELIHQGLPVGDDASVSHQLMYAADVYRTICTKCTTASSVMSGFFTDNLYNRMVTPSPGGNADMTRAPKHYKMIKI
jgi:hypothetical protein